MADPHCHRAAVNSRVGSMLTLGDEHVVVCINEVLCELLCGGRCERVLNHPLREVPGATEAFVPLLSKALRGVVLDAETERAWDHPLRGRVHLDLLAVPREDATGATVGLQVFVTDATEKVRTRARLHEVAEQLKTFNERLLISSLREEKLAEEAEDLAEERRALLDNLSDGVITIAASGRVTLANGAARSLLGLSEPPATLEDTGCWEIRSKEDGPLPESERPGLRVLRGERLWAQEYTLHRSDDTRRAVMISGGSVRDEAGAVREAVLVFHDVTQLRDLERLREEYLALTSHDLRSPLASISLATQGLRRRLSPPAPETGYLLARIESNAQRMDAMLQDLLETARLESGSFSLQKRPIDLFALIRGVVERMAVERVELKLCPQPCLVDADPERLERVVVNLLSNALKYSTPPSVVVVEVRPDRRHAVLSVTDHGVGIPKDQLAHLFHRFFRARTGKKLEGLGLGLHIARLVVEAHGGRIWVRSEEGRGSTFYISLPSWPRLADTDSPWTAQAGSAPIGR
ncbi:MAG: PAS domain-containing protein [Deltaproteobacteria bacterium]|nr:PAS domain-containing protein [Deltaproteobacteria bacterium]